MNYLKRFLRPPEESFFLFGPRGTGKSTWLLHTYPHAFRIDLLNTEEEQRYAARPQRLKEEIGALTQGVCIIDEVQRVPTLLPIVHSLIEEGSTIQFILTGSSARKLRHVSSDLLGGRAYLRHMHPFLAIELGDEFSLERALKVGLVPMICKDKHPQEKLRSYAALYLREEVQAEGLVRKIGDFARFMEVMSFSHANQINCTKIAQEAHVKRQTVENYLQILEDLLLGFTLYPFTPRAVRAIVSHPKFYYFDPGIFRQLRPRGPFDRDSELEGQALEGLVAAHIRTWVLNQLETYQFAFWRTRTGLEVDFVVYGPLGCWAIEVKRTKELSPTDFRSLVEFKKDYPEAKCIMLYGGTKRYVFKDVLVVPVEEFLLQIHPEKPLWT